MKKVNIFILVTIICLTGLIQCVSPLTYTRERYVAAAEVSAKIEKPTVALQTRTATTVTLSLKKVQEATSYRVYRATRKKGTYKYIGVTRSTRYRDTKLESAKTYYYKVRAYHGQKKSAYSDIVTAKRGLAKTKDIKVTANKNKTLTIAFDQVKNADWYKIYRSSSRSGTYHYVGKAYGTRYIDNEVGAGKTYYYKMRAYHKANKINYYGAFSKKVYAKVLKSTVTYTQSNSEFRKEVLKLVNLERTKRKLNDLKANNKLNQAAYKRSTEIGSIFSHTRPDGSNNFTVLKEYKINYYAAGENIAYGQRTPKDVVDAWMDSPGHKANILNDLYGKLGIGACKDSEGNLYWVQIFTN